MECLKTDFDERVNKERGDQGFNFTNPLAQIENQLAHGFWDKMYNSLSPTIFTSTHNLKLQPFALSNMSKRAAFY